MERKLIYTEAFDEFKKGLTPRALNKIDHCLDVLKQAMPLSQKFVKKIINSDFYELRVSIDNEIRVILFAFDNDNINNATQILILNGFVKKSNKDYEKQIVKAYNILNSMI